MDWHHRYLVAGLGPAALLGRRCWQATGAFRVTAAATTGGAKAPST